MKNVNVLLIEENQINQLIVGRLLRKWGLGVTIANHVREALAMISCKNFQLVLIDLQMPEMDGFESTSMIRSMDDVYFKNVPILAFATTSMKNVFAKGKLCGISDFINRPFASEDFQSKINQYLDLQDDTPSQKTRRTLFIDFDLYTDGEAAFKQELILLMISNIYELTQCLQNAIASNDMKAFRKICHKTAPTITMIDDPELTHVLIKLRVDNFQPNEQIDNVSTFNRVCCEIIASLEEEYQIMQK